MSKLLILRKLFKIQRSVLREFWQKNKLLVLQSPQLKQYLELGQKHSFYRLLVIFKMFSLNSAWIFTETNCIVLNTHMLGLLSSIGNYSHGQIFSSCIT